MESIEIEAKTVEEAIAAACEQLKTAKENLKIEVLQDAPGRIFSFMTNKKAKIRATPIKPFPKERVFEAAKVAEQLKETLETIVQYISPSASVAMEKGEDGIVLNIIGDGSGIFIGKKGQTLEALQYIINKIKIKCCNDSFSVSVDSESYRARHNQSLVTLAQQLGIKAKKRNGPVTTNPLSSADRRIIHLALKGDSELTTWSKGEGSFKKVIIAPKQPDK